MGSELRPAGHPGYAVSIAAGRRRWEVPKSRLERPSPTKYDPVAIKSRTAGRQITGTVELVGAQDSIVEVNVSHGDIFWHNVRNVRTYAAAAEATWGTIEIGDPIYYDRSPTMPANVFLSTSPLDSAGVANPLFGHVVLNGGESSADFPKGSGSATSVGLAVMQIGSS